MAEDHYIDILLLQQKLARLEREHILPRGQGIEDQLPLATDGGIHVGLSPFERFSGSLRLPEKRSKDEVHQLVRVPQLEGKGLLLEAHPDQAGDRLHVVHKRILLPHTRREIHEEAVAPAALQPQLTLAVPQEGVGEIAEEAVLEVLVAVLYVEPFGAIDAGALEVEELLARVAQVLAQVLPHARLEEVHIVVSGDDHQAVIMIS